MTNLPDHLKPWSTINDDELNLLYRIAHAAYHGEDEAATDLAIELKNRFHAEREDLPR